MSARLVLGVLVCLMLVGSSGLSTAAVTAAPSATDHALPTLQGCSNATAYVTNAVWSHWWIDYWHSQNLTTSGCGPTYNIRASTNDMAGGTCISLRVRLFPSHGGPSIVPRGWQYTCPGTTIELANYVLAGTTYRVESDNGSATVRVQH